MLNSSSSNNSQTSSGNNPSTNQPTTLIPNSSTTSITNQISREKVNAPKIKKLNQEIELYKMAIESDETDHNALNLLGKSYIELTKLSDNSNHDNYKAAILYFSKAIELEQKASYFCDRAKAYSTYEPEKAVEDFRVAGELNKKSPESSILEQRYLKNLLEDLSKIDSIKTTIKHLREKGELPSEFLTAFDNLTQITSNLCLRVKEHDDEIKAIIARAEILSFKLDELTQRMLDKQKKSEMIEEIVNEIKDATYIVIKKEIDELQKDSPEMYEYFKTLNFIISNTFFSYKYISSGEIQKDYTTDTTDLEKITVSAAKLGFANDFIKTVPIIGGVASLIEKAIDSVYQEVKEVRGKNKVNAISFIIKEKFQFSQEMEVAISKSVLQITKDKKEEILNHTTKEISSLDKIKDQLKTLKQKILPEIKLHNEQSPQVEKAIIDSVTLLAYLILEHQTVAKEDLTQHFLKALDTEYLPTQASEAQPQEQKIDMVPQEPKPQEQKCLIFALTSIIYDNPLLNNPELSPHELNEILGQFNEVQI